MKYNFPARCLREAVTDILKASIVGYRKDTA